MPLRPFLARSCFLVLAFACIASLPRTALAQDAGTLRQKAVAMQDRFATNPFGRPLVLESTQSSGDLRGDVYAVVEYPFASVDESLKSIDHWCDILILHLNVKRCRGNATDGKLALDIGRKFDQPIEDAQRLAFGYKVAASSADYLQVQLSAPEGPYGTSNYRIQVEAAPLESRKTMIHMSYAYSTGMMARMAVSTYLSTVGRDKVGFTVVDKTPDGKPVHVGGVVGLLERNTMRYYLAIDAYLAARTAPASEQVEKRIRGWYASTERYATQLHEMEQAEYLAMKRKEIARQSAPT